MSPVRINQIPQTTTLTNDDLFLIMDNPSSDQVTKSISFANLRNSTINTPTSGVTYGFRNNELVDITSPANLQIRRGTFAEISGIIPLEAEPIWGTDNNTLYIGDGSTYGGIPVSYPIKVARDTAGSSAPSNSTPITIGPQNSVWEFSWMAQLGSNGGDYADNSIVTIKVTNFNGLGPLFGSALFIDAAGAVFHNILTGSDLTYNIVGNNEFIKIYGIVQVTSSTGTLAFGIYVDNVQSGNHIPQSVCIGKRII